MKFRVFSKGDLHKYKTQPYKDVVHLCWAHGRNFGRPGYWISGWRGSWNLRNICITRLIGLYSGQVFKKFADTGVGIEVGNFIGERVGVGVGIAVGTYGIVEFSRVNDARCGRVCRDKLFTLVGFMVDLLVGFAVGNLVGESVGRRVGIAVGT